MVVAVAVVPVLLVETDLLIQIMVEQEPLQQSAVQLQALVLLHILQEVDLEDTRLPVMDQRVQQIQVMAELVQVVLSDQVLLVVMADLELFQLNKQRKLVEQQLLECGA